MKYQVYCVLYTVHQFIEALGMFFFSTALIRRLRWYAATFALFKKGHSMVNVFSSVFSGLSS